MNLFVPEAGVESGAPVPPNSGKPLPIAGQPEAKTPAKQDESPLVISPDTIPAIPAVVQPNGDVTTVPEAIGGPALLEETSSLIDGFVKLDKSEREAVTLWLFASRCTAFTLVNPMLYFMAPGTECGKTKALNIVRALAHNPVVASSITSAVTYRAISARSHGNVPPTLVLDNAHQYLSGDSRMVAIISGSYDKAVAKAIITGYRDGVPEGIDEFSTWCPKCMAGNGRLPGDLMGRSVVIGLKRKLRKEVIRQVEYEDPDLFAELRRKIDRWLEENEWRIRAVLRKFSDGRNNRAGDKWAAMLAIARVAGGDWYERAQSAMRKIARSVNGSQDPSELLIWEIQRYAQLHGGSFVSSTDFLAWLKSDPGSPWLSYGEKEKPFNFSNLRDIMQGKHRILADQASTKGRPRGYQVANLQDLFARYPLPADETIGESGQDEAGEKA